MKLSEIKKNPKNPRIVKDDKFEKLKRSITEFPEMMELRPMVVDADGIILGGNMRFEAIRALGMKEVPDEWVKRADQLTEEQKQEFIIKDNVGFGEWDWDSLANEWDDLPLNDWGLDVPSLEMAEDDGGESAEKPKALTLSERFLVPPFSVLDARQGYWQDRKRAWLAIGIQSELGRGDTAGSSASAAPGEEPTYRQIASSGNGLLGISQQARSHYGKASPGGSPRPAMKLNAEGKTDRGDGKGKAMKDPGRCFGQDLMRGEHTLGAVAPNEKGKNGILSSPGKYSTSQTGETASLQGGLTHGLTIHPYDGSSSEVQSGTSIFDPVLCELAYRWFCSEGAKVLDPFAGGSVRGIVAARLGREYVGIDLRAEQIAANEEQAREITPNNAPRWIVGNSEKVKEIAPGEYDLFFTCPPYADLEVYSEDPQDLSTMKYPEFLASYRRIIADCLSMLKENRFACIVVGDIRDKKGIYRNFVSDTIAAFQDAGAKLYNEAILVTAIGSLPIRVGRQFESGRKLGKTHQNVLVFIKGNPAKASFDCGKVEVCDLAEEFGEVITDAS